MLHLTKDQYDRLINWCSYRETNIDPCTRCTTYYRNHYTVCDSVCDLKKSYTEGLEHIYATIEDVFEIPDTHSFLGDILTKIELMNQEKLVDSCISNVDKRISEFIDTLVIDE